MKIAAWWTGSILLATLLAVAVAWYPLPSSAPPTKVADRSHPLAPAYVGDAVCADCHETQAELHRRSGHSRTLATTNLCETLALLLDREFQDPYRRGVFRFECENGNVFAEYADAHGQTTRLPIDLVVGSGAHARSFLTLVPDSGGEPKAVEHRVTLFAEEPRIGLTPSHKDDPIREPLEKLGRMKHGDQVRRCVECHSTTSYVDGARVRNLRANVNCERCHGPGLGHVQAVESGAADLAIQFGPRRAAALEEVQLCGQCHRVPDSIQRLPDPDDPLLARFQPIGIMQSACFRKSDGGLRCSTCHNPHAPLNHDTSYGNQQCLNCHSPNQETPRVTCKVASQGECVECHMPRVPVPPGFSFRDHWIRPRQAPAVP